MIRVLVGDNLDRTTKSVDPSRTIKSVLEENNIDYSTGGVFLDGEAITAADINSSFTAKGITEDCMLIAVTKASGGC